MRSLASRLDVIQPSATIAIANKARTLRAQGIDVLSFSLGEPDFETPAHIAAAGKRAIDEGATRYTAAIGTPELRAAIAERSAARRGVTHSPDEIVVSVGAKHTLFNLALALFEAGDEVLIPAPYWVSYPEQVRLAGAAPVIVETREAEGFRLSPEALRAALTPKTKAFLLCSPSNPTGAAYTRAQLEAIAEVLRAHSCWIIVDEIYGELVYGGFEQTSLLTIAPDLRERIIVVDGVSKTYAMTGWRIGWMLAPKEVAKACGVIQSQSTTNPCAIAQAAATEAMRGSQACVAEMRAAFEARRSVLVDGLNAIEGLRANLPEGAFYAFANVQALLPATGKAGLRVGDRRLQSDLDVCDFFLEEARCAFVPGSAFGAPGYLRISYACAIPQIEEGLERLRAALATLS